MTPRLWTRIVLVYLGLGSLQNGLWALFAPQSFYDGFPGFGREWISVDGPYNEHFIRDFGALNLALTVLLFAALFTMSRQMVTTAAVAAIVWGAPHFVYHVFNTEGLEGIDLVVSLTGLAVFPLVALSLLFSGTKLASAEAA